MNWDKFMVGQNQEELQNENLSKAQKFKCPDCWKMVDSSMTKCPICGLSMEAAKEGKVTKKKIRREGDLTPKQILYTLAVVLLVPLFFLIIENKFCNGVHSPATAIQRPEHDAETAYYMSQKFVKKNIKTPSTAEFPMYGRGDGEVKVRTINNDEYSVHAYVDAQNLFGAMVRSEYTCELKYTGNHNWELVKLTIE